MSEFELRDEILLQTAVGTLRAFGETVDALGKLANTANNQLEMQMYLLGIIPLPRHLRAWRVARRYKQLVSRGDKG